MPQLGESMAEATIVANQGATGRQSRGRPRNHRSRDGQSRDGYHDALSGRRSRTIDAEVKGIYAVGAVLGYVEASEADAARFVKKAPEPPSG